MIITLIGYMGSGKTSLAKVLAQELNFVFFDMDSLIEHELQREIRSVFDEKGEIYFRKTEREILIKTLSRKEKIVLSLGGGTPCYYDNIRLINQKSKSIYLDCSVRILTERLKKEKNTRPIIAHVQEDKLLEFVSKHLFERRIFYEKAKYRIKSDNRTLNELVDKIKRKIAKPLEK